MQSAAQLVTQARQMAHSGRYGDARNAYRQAIAAMPRNPELLLELGVLAGQNGDLATARHTLEKARKLDRNDANITFNLGQVAKAEGKHERAMQHFQQTLELDPTYHEALFDLGECLYLIGRMDEALARLEQATKVSPGDAEAHHLKGLVLYVLGRKSEAKAAYRKALDIDPRHVNACLNLAMAEAESGAPWVAQDLVEQIEASPGIPAEGWALAARVLHLVGEQDRAIDYVNRSLEAGLHVQESLMSRINIAIDQGDFDAAEVELRKLSGDKRHAPWASSRLAFIKRLEPEAASRLKNWAEDNALAVNSRASACFALYSLLDQRGDDEAAFATLRKANDLKREVSPSQTQQQIAVSCRIIETFTPEFLVERSAWGCPDEGPIYVFGMPRSGTTLTEQILAAHPRIFPGGERQDVARARMEISNWPEEANTLGADKVARMGSALIAKMKAVARGEDFVTDKTPGNYVLLGLIHLLLPRAKLVYVRRDPGGNMLSLYEQNFLRGLNYSYDLNEIADVYRSHLELMRHWIGACKLPIHTVDYETLVTDPEPNVRALLDFVGVDFHSECLRPELVKRNVSTSSGWQVRQPIGTGSVERWRRYERQLEPFVRAIGEPR